MRQALDNGNQIQADAALSEEASGAAVSRNPELAAEPVTQGPPSSSDNETTAAESPNWLMWGAVGAAGLGVASLLGRGLRNIGNMVVLGGVAFLGLMMFPELREPLQKFHRLFRGVKNGISRILGAAKDGLKSAFDNATGVKPRVPPAPDVPVRPPGQASDVPGSRPAPDAPGPRPDAPARPVDTPPARPSPAAAPDAPPARPAGSSFNDVAPAQRPRPPAPDVPPVARPGVPGTAGSASDVAQTFGHVAANHTDEVVDAARLARIARAGDPHDFLNGLRRFADHAGDAIRIGGRGARVLSLAGRALGPVGLALVAWEVFDLEKKAQAAVADGRMSQSSFYAYQGILGVHAAQCGLDPTLFGAEVGVQTAYDQFAKAAGIAEDRDLLDDLRPSSLLRMIGIIGGEPDPDAMAVQAGTSALSSLMEPTRFRTDLSLASRARDMMAALREADKADDFDKVMDVSGRLVEAALDDIDDRMRRIVELELLPKINRARGEGSHLSAPQVVEMLGTLEGRRELENINAFVRGDIQQFVSPLLTTRASLDASRRALAASAGRIDALPGSRAEPRRPVPAAQPALVAEPG